MEKPKHKITQEQLLEVIDDMYLTLGGKKELTELGKGGKEHITETFFIDFILSLELEPAIVAVEKLVEEYELNHDWNFDDLKSEEEIEQYKKDFPDRFENDGEFDYIEAVTGVKED